MVTTIELGDVTVELMRRDVKNVKVSRYFLQRMKTRWGGCNHSARTIRLNSELVKKPKDLLEYVIVHERAHLIEPTHGPRFIALLDQYSPSWREARAELNELPLGGSVNHSSELPLIANGRSPRGTTGRTSRT